jgi:hypothetical protein
VLGAEDQPAAAVVQWMGVRMIEALHLWVAI